MGLLYHVSIPWSEIQQAIPLLFTATEQDQVHVSIEPRHFYNKDIPGTIAAITEDGDARTQTRR